jgi:hypothetical protein
MILTIWALAVGFLLGAMASSCQEDWWAKCLVIAWATLCVVLIVGSSLYTAAKLW